ncbi:MAG: FtsX-like permease family protein, partial [Acidimicrobiales bacterium]
MAPRQHGVSRGALGVAWYRFRATFGRRWGSYLALVVLVGLVGGVGMGAIAAARRTQSSFSTFLASTNPPDLTVTIYGANANGAADNPSYSTRLTKEIAGLPHVRAVHVGLLLTAAPLNGSGAPRIDSTALAYPVGSVDGLFFTQDRVAVTAGRMADPDRPHEIMMTALAAHQLGFHLGETIPYGVYSQQQQDLPGFGTAAVRPLIRFSATLVGYASLSSEIIEDDIDQVPTFIILTPALVKEVVAQIGQDSFGAEVFSIQTDHGSRDVAAVELEMARLIPSQAISSVHATAPVTAKADRSLKPIGIALGVFGAIALLAALFIGTQAISRRLRVGGEDTAVLRALGADPAMTTADGLIGIEGAIVLGSLLAAAVAVALSPLSPLGPVRSVYPTPGISFDWTVLGVGLLALIGGLSAIAVFLAYRGAPHRVTRRERLAPHVSSKTAQGLATAGLPVTGVVGVRMALEPGAGRTAVPVRSALLGTGLAISLVVATVVFGSSLATLVSHPPLYGWNWSYMLSQVGSGGGNVPPQAFTLLAHDRDVAAYTGISYLDGEIDHQGVPFLIGDNHPAVSPPILSGHTVDGNHEIVLGGATMAALHEHLGGTVTFSYGTAKNAPIYVPPTRLTIVGTATMPAVGFASVISDHTSMGTGALLSAGVLPRAFLGAMNSPDPTLNGPNLALVRLRSGVSAATGRANLQRIADSANKAFAAVPDGGGSGDTIAVVGVQRPAEIVNYRTIGATPTLLVSALALGAVSALALTLVASVRRRRRDLALLKSIGFTQRQLGAAVAWQASVNAVVGIAIGIPLGILVGRWLWVLFARQIYAVPEPSVPVVSVLLVAIGALVLANVV